MSLYFKSSNTLHFHLLYCWVQQNYISVTHDHSSQVEGYKLCSRYHSPVLCVLRGGGAFVRAYTCECGFKKGSSEVVPKIVAGLADS